MAKRSLYRKISYVVKSAKRFRLSGSTVPDMEKTTCRILLCPRITSL
jgi:hypothetical protein